MLILHAGRGDRFIVPVLVRGQVNHKKKVEMMAVFMTKYALEGNVKYIFGGMAVQ